MQRFEYDFKSPRGKSCESCAPRAARATLLEKILTGLVVLLAIIIIFFIAYTVISHEIPVCQTKACVDASAKLLNSIDKSSTPCDNFYNFVCGTFMQQALELNILSRMQDLKERAKRRYEYFILEAKGNTQSLQIQRKYFDACMDEVAIELDGNKRFLNLVEHFGGWPLMKGRNWNRSSYDHVHAMKTARHLGLDGEWFIVFDVYERFEDNQTNLLELNIPINANNITDVDAYAKTILDIRDIFLNTPNKNRTDEDVNECHKMINFENSLAVICLEDNYDDQDLPQYKIKELHNKFQLSIDWVDLINNMTKRNFTEDDIITVGDKEYLIKLHKLLQATPPRIQANYIMWKTIEATVPFLSHAVRERYETYRRKMEGESYQEITRFHFCNDEVSTKLGYAKSADYLRQNMNKEKREDLQQMVRSIREQFEKKIKETAWMDSATRQKALSRLNSMNYVIGGLEEMFDEKTFNHYIGIDRIELKSDNLIDILTEIYSKGADHLYSKLGEHTNKTKIKFYDSIESVNPRYMLEENNTLFLPVGGLQDGFHDVTRPQYLNYGTIGYIIAHEMTHGLSEIYLDKPSDDENKPLPGRVKCLENNCLKVAHNIAKWKTIDGEKVEAVDCTKTVFEDFADHMGIQIAYKAYQQWVKTYGKELRLSGLRYNQNQLFWIINASLMCNKIPPGAEPEFTINHLPPPVRLLGYVRNSEYFKNDFHCPVGANMNPSEKCDVS